MNKTLTASLILFAGMMTNAASDPFEKTEGQWIRNHVAEALISGRPYPRLTAFRRLGGESPFRVSTRDPFCGVRTWFMEPVGLATTHLPALQQATVERIDARTLRLVADPEPETKLQVLWEVALDAELPRIHLRHGLRNVADRKRRLAAWAIMVFPHAGVGVTPWASGKDTIRSYLLFPGVDPTEPSLRLDAAGVGVDFRVFAKGSHAKIGTNADSGWVAYLWQGQALKSCVPWVEGAEYPEGGGSVTFYQTGRRLDQGFCEVEHVGPLTDVNPGDILWLEQTIDWLSGVTVATESPAGWIQAVLDAETMKERTLEHE